MARLTLMRISSLINVMGFSWYLWLLRYSLKAENNGNASRASQLMPGLFILMTIWLRFFTLFLVGDAHPTSCSLSRQRQCLPIR